MVSVQTQIHINRPRTEVADYAANPDNAPKWYANIHKSQRLTADPVGAGSKVAFTAKFLGRELNCTYEFVEYVPGEKLVMRTAQEPFPMHTTYTWTDDDGGTRMSLGNTGSPAGFSKLAGLVNREIAGKLRARRTGTATLQLSSESGVSQIE